MPAPNIELQVRHEQLQVRSPMNTLFGQRAKKIGGRWEPKEAAWVFDARVDDKVRALCIDCYGNDGTTFQELVDIRVKFLRDLESSKGPITVFGRIIGSAKARDSGARLGNGVVLEEGRIGSAGSYINWTTAVDAGTQVILFDVPKALVLAGGEKHVEINIVESNQTTSEEQEGDLTAERERLLARLAQIDAVLALSSTHAGDLVASSDHGRPAGARV
jgi:hypothetical protein